MKRISDPNSHLYQWYDSVAKLPADWDAALPEKHFLIRDALLAHERALLPDITTVYATVRQQDRIVFLAAFQLLSIRPEHFSDKSLKTFPRLGLKIFLTTIKPKLLVAGQLFRHDIATTHWSESQSDFDAYKLYKALIEQGLKRYCAQAALVKELHPSLIPYFQHYAPEYMLLRNDTSMQMSIPDEWLSSIEYEKSLKHKYAQRFRKVRQSWQALEIKELTLQEVRANAATIYNLYLQVTQNQPVRLGLLSEQFLPELKSYYGEKLKIWGIYEGDQLIAFASAWVQEAMN